MKKTILIFAFTGIVFSSCSGEGGENNLTPSFQTLEGVWHIKESIKPDGTIEPYVNLCATKRDFVDFNYPDIEYFSHYDTCEAFLRSDCTDYYLTPNEYRIIALSSIFRDGRITQLTSKKMKIEYDDAKSFPYQSNHFSSVKAIILTKE
ncbi:hypothetical protein [Flavobacterium sedimenticola]|uniref:Lipocalin-like domain-containing protein n=1 Tax=Flavobacterium sedimenticola TaxID=3043286 RepID=A0ABT6XS05_9FLAO|nr:hypothetical protein [Flavobacterium sedimenticola]MDI9257873.1 hypothetical protein [Flavobacterium sedimenticola]